MYFYGLFKRSTGSYSKMSFLVLSLSLNSALLFSLASSACSCLDKLACLFFNFSISCLNFSASFFSSSFLNASLSMSSLSFFSILNALKNPCSFLMAMIWSSRCLRRGMILSPPLRIDARYLSSSY